MQCCVVLFGICLAMSLVNAEWQLVFHDDFNHNGDIDGHKWKFDVGGDGWGNNEWQYYTTHSRNARCELFPHSANGRLIIEAHRQNYGENRYTSARIVTKQAWTYGRWQIRAKVPNGRGLWSAIWMLPQRQHYGDRMWPDNGEINIMEHVGMDRSGIHSTVHTKAHNHRIHSHPTNRVTVHDAVTRYKIYTLDWKPHRLRMFVGDDESNAMKTEVLFWDNKGDWKKWPFDQPFHLIINLAVGGEWGGQQGIDSRALPAKFEVDWVKYYQER